MKKITLLLLVIVHCNLLLAQKKSLMVGQTKRSYIVYVPPAYHQNNSSIPLVFNFHGGGMTAVEQMLYTQMNRCADKNNFIVVYPTGIQHDWNVGFDMSYVYGNDDIAFIKALISKLKADYRIDDKAIFASGLSRGGFFCYRLAAEMPEIFAAIASVGGPLPDSVKFYHKNDKPVSVMHVHGTDDQVVKFDGKDEGYASALSTFNYWRMHNNLSKTQIKNSTIDLVEDETAVEITESENETSTVMLLTIKGGGHTWPGSDAFNIGYPLGKTTRDIDFNLMMWEFFRKNRKK